MFYLLSIIGLALLGGIAALAQSFVSRKGEENEASSQGGSSEGATECCGQHEVCEKESLLAAISKQIEYYDDEELDRFKGRGGDEYTEEEAEEFRNVLYTMRSEEVAGWVRSLQLRQVNLPDEMKDEVFMIVGERREGKKD